MKRLLLILAVLALVPSVTLAAPVYCSDVTPHPAGLALIDVTFNGAAANDCYGVVATQGGNNDSLNLVNDLELWGGGWDAMVRDAGSVGSTPYAGYIWTLDVVNFDTTDEWRLTLSPDGPTLPLPVTLDFITVLKAGNQFAAYLFDDVQVSAANDGTYRIAFTHGTAINGLSHMSLYFRDPEVPQVPEPASMLLLGSGLFGLAGMARRRRR